MVSGISASLSGLNQAAARLYDAGENIARANPSKAGAADKASIDKDLIDSKQAEADYAANAKVLKAQLDNEKKILDILA